MDHSVLFDGKCKRIPDSVRLIPCKRQQSVLHIPSVERYDLGCGCIIIRSVSFTFLCFFICFIILTLIVSGLCFRCIFFGITCLRRISAGICSICILLFILRRLGCNGRILNLFLHRCFLPFGFDADDKTYSRLLTDQSVKSHDTCR